MRRSSCVNLDAQPRRKPVKLAMLSAAALTLAFAQPAFAAESNSTLAKQIQQLQEQLRSLQQQLDQVKTNESSSRAAVAQQAAATEAATKQAAEAQAAAQAATKATKEAPKVTQSASNLFGLSSADGRNTIAVTGRVHLDLGDYVGFKADNAVVGIGNPTTGNLSSGFNARRARIGVQGKVMGDWTYAFIYDGGNSQDTTAKGIETALIGYTGFKNTIIEVGYTDTLFTLDEANGSNNIMFMERPTPQVIATQFGGGDNRSEFGVRTWGDRYWLGAYLTGPAIGVSHTLTAEQFGAYQRATYQIVQEKDKTVHIGVGLLEMFKAPNTGPGTARSITLSDQPELRIDPTTFLNTGALGTVANPVTSGMVYNLETAASYGGFFAQAEYFHYDIKRLGKTKAGFDGGYGQISYTFGGRRNYVANTGAYSSVIPDQPFSLSSGGYGAWEIAARISYVELIDQFVSGTSLALQPNAVNGGRQTNYTVGLNWYINSNMRWMLNYVHARYKKANSTAVAGAPLGTQVGAEIDALAIRWQVAF